MQYECPALHRGSPSAPPKKNPKEKEISERHFKQSQLLDSWITPVISLLFKQTRGGRKESQNRNANWLELSARIIHSVVKVFEFFFFWLVGGILLFKSIALRFGNMQIIPYFFERGAALNDSIIGETSLLWTYN